MSFTDSIFIKWQNLNADTWIEYLRIYFDFQIYCIVWKKYYFIPFKEQGVS